MKSKILGLPEFIFLCSILSVFTYFTGDAENWQYYAGYIIMLIVIQAKSQIVIINQSEIKVKFFFITIKTIKINQVKEIIFQKGDTTMLTIWSVKFIIKDEKNYKMNISLYKKERAYLKEFAIKHGLLLSDETKDPYV